MGQDVLGLGIDADSDVLREFDSDPIRSMSHQHAQALDASTLEWALQSSRTSHACAAASLGFRLCAMPVARARSPLSGFRRTQ